MEGHKHSTTVLIEDIDFKMGTGGRREANAKMLPAGISVVH